MFLLSLKDVRSTKLLANLKQIGEITAIVIYVEGLAFFFLSPLCPNQLLVNLLNIFTDSYIFSFIKNITQWKEVSAFIPQPVQHTSWQECTSLGCIIHQQSPMVVDLIDDSALGLIFNNATD